MSTHKSLALPDLDGLYDTIQKNGKKDLNTNKFSLLRIALAAKGRDDLKGRLIQAQVHIFFNDFADAEEILLVVNKIYPKNIDVLHMFLSLYTLWGKWQSLREKIYELYTIKNINEILVEKNSLSELVFPYAGLFCDLGIFELIDRHHQIKDREELFMDIQYANDVIKEFGVNIDAVRDIIGIASQVFYKEYLGEIEVEIVTSDEINILLFVSGFDINDLMNINSKLIKEKLKFARKSEENRKNNDYISATFLPLNNHKEVLT